MKKCLIIGADSSLGSSLIDKFSSQDFQVYGTTRHNLNPVNDNIFKIDFDNDSELKNLAKKVESLDTVIYCTGLLLGKSLQEYHEKDFYNVFNSNILLILKSLQVINKMLNRGASVLFISSIAGIAGSYDEVYAAAKSSLIGLTKSLAKKTNNEIRYNCLAPGLIIDSGMSKRFSDTEINRHISETPTGKLLTLKDVTDVCFDLCSNHWSGLNGQTINLNGGRYV